MKVIVIENGQQYEFPVTKDHTVLQLKEMVMKMLGLSVEDQILLYEGQRLENNDNLGKYSLPMTQGDVFLLDKTLLLNESKEFTDETLPVVETEAKPVSMMISSQDAHITGLFALKRIEHQFIDDFNSAKTLIEASKTYGKLALQYLGDQERMLKGLSVAFLNLRDHFMQVQTTASEKLVPYHERLFSKHQKALENFETSFNKIKNTKIHQALAQTLSQRAEGNSNELTLKNFIPNFETVILKLKSDCETSHVQLHKQIAALLPSISAVKDEVEDQLRTRFDKDPSIFQSSVKRANEIASDISLRLEIFQKNLDQIQEALSILRKTQVVSSVEIWEEISSANTSQLAQLTQPATVIKGIASQVLAAKNKMKRFVGSQLVNLYKLQSKIKEIANNIVVYNDSLNRQRHLFQQLLSVEMLPRAYEAGIEEVSRRRKFMKRFTSICTEANDAAVKLLMEEKTKRKEFIETYGRYLPRDLIPGLLEDVPQVQLLQTPPFDTALPPIDLSESYHRSELSPSSSFSRILREAPSERFTTLEKENEKLAAELKSLKENLFTQSSVAKSRESMIQPETYYQLKQEFEKSKQQGLDYQKRIENLESQLSTTYAKIDIVESKAVQYQEQLKKTEKKVEEAQQTESSKTQKLLAEKDAEIERLKVQQQEIAEKLEVQSNKLDEQSKKLEEQISDIESLEQNIAIETEKADAALAAAADYEDEIKSLSKKLKNMEARNKQSMEQTEALQSQLEAKSAELEKTEQELEEEQENNADLKKQLAELTETTDQDVVTLKEEIGKLIEINKKLSNDLEQETQERLNAEAFLSKSNVMSDTATKVLGETKEQLEKARSELKAAQANLSAISGQLDQSKQTEKDLKAMMDSAKTEAANAKQKSENLQTKYLEIVKLMEQKSKSIGDLEKEKEKLVNDAKNSQEAMLNLNEFMMDIEKTLKIPHSSKLITDSFIIIRKRLKEQLDAAQHKIQSLESDIKTLELIVNEGTTSTPKTPVQSHVMTVDNFQLGDRILFLWDDTKQCYQAYQRGKANSNFFLSTSVVEHLSEVEKTKRAPIIGEILMIEQFKATSSYNPFSLPENTMFSEVYVQKCKQFLV